ncbi:MAG: hypothetical protein ABSD53_09635 [Terriglobales bacterium]|jgi:transposase-like protein
MVDWVGAENTGIPYALALALRGKSLQEIARETGIAESALSKKNMSASWAAVDKHILDALALALEGTSITEIAIATGIPKSSLHSIRKHGPYAHRNKGSISANRPDNAPEGKPRAVSKESIQESLSTSEELPMNDEMQEMARRSYGYGRWDAPYWFIGPEQGQGSHENDNDLKPRLEAWLYFGGRELDDCHDFHDRIGEKRWHRETPQLQRTWKGLMLLLMAFLGKPTDDESLRRYQRDEWGSLSGETCVIELSGLAAKSAKVRRDRKSFRPERIETIREKMLHCQPELVVMYGASEKRHWEAIIQQRFPPEGFLKLGHTIVAQPLHPMAHGKRAPDSYWGEWGERLRDL